MTNRVGGQALTITSDVFPPMGTLVQQLGFSVDKM